jgi:hypothetical protein
MRRRMIAIQSGTTSKTLNWFARPLWTVWLARPCLPNPADGVVLPISAARSRRWARIGSVRGMPRPKRAERRLLALDKSRGQLRRGPKCSFPAVPSRAFQCRCAEQQTGRVPWLRPRWHIHGRQGRSQRRLPQGRSKIGPSHATHIKAAAFRSLIGEQPLKDAQALRFIKVVAQIQELARRHRMYRSIA